MTATSPVKTGAACAVCETSGPASLYKGLVKCRACGFVWADSELSPAILQELYSRNYFFGGEYNDYLSEEKALNKDFQKAYARIAPFHRGGRLLEIGCAYGFSLNIARKLFTEVTGAELNPEAVDHARKSYGLDVRAGDFLSMDFPDNHFDVIVCWATLEHLQTPNLYVEKISRLLKPGGIFACTTVDIGALVPRIRGAKWRQIHPPTHVSYYSGRTLPLLLQRFGLTTIHQEHMGNYRTIDNMLYGVLVLVYRQAWLYNFLKKLGLNRGVLYLNLFDTLLAVARKAT